MCSAPASAQDWRYHRLESALRDARGQYRIPGLAAAVVEDGRVVWRFTSGNLSAEALHDVASLTKTMASVLILQEIEAGRLKLTDPVPALPGVQLRQLLSHTSGPGQEFHYDNARFHLLTALLERRAGAPFPELLRQRVFRPARMTASRPSFSAAAGVLASLDDLARYAAALDTRTLLRDRSKSLMWTPARPDIPYGLGWFATTRHGEKVAWHYGLDGSSSSLIIKVPTKKISLIVLANSAHLGEEFHHPLPDLFRSRIARAFLDSSFNQFEGLLVAAASAHQR